MGLSSNASNVLLAKCRARYGKRLTAQDISALVGCRSVQDVAAYLKSGTHYSEALAGIDTSVVHRRQLETILRTRLYDDFSSLCRYELSVGEWFGDYIMLRGEIQLIMSYLWLLSAGRQNEFIFTLSGFYQQHLDLDLSALLEAKSYGDFLFAMRKSTFIKVLRAFTPLEDEPIDCAMIEHALYRHFYTTIFDIIDKHYSGSARDELEDMFGTNLDIRNFCHIYRMKKYYGCEPSAVRAFQYGEGQHIRPRVMRSIVEAPDAQTALDIFVEQTRYGRLVRLEEMESGGIEAATRSAIFGKALRLLRSSVNPTTVLLAFITLAEAELQDVITIVEGVHYGLAQNVMLDMITIDNFYD